MAGLFPALGDAVTDAAGAAGKAVVLAGKKAGAKANPAPADKAAAAKAAAVAASQPTAADLISQYNLAKAQILQHIAPQVQDIYSRANTDLQGAVGPLTQDVRSRLFDAGTAESDALAKQMNGLTSLGTDVTPAFHPDETANAAYALGAAFPGESLAKQGAAFGAAAAFLPAAALEQGQMALSKYLSDQQVSAAKQSQVNVGVSKLLGYVSDANGNPITGKGGKIIRLPAGGGLTDYQKASLALRAGELDYRTQHDKTMTDLATQRANDVNRRYYAGLKFKSTQAAAAARDKAGQIDWTNTIKVANANGGKGVILGKDGLPIHDKNGRTVSFSVAPKPGKAPSLTQTTALLSQLDTWAHGARPKYNSRGEELPGTGAGAISYQKAINKLVTAYHMSRAQATELANQAYDPGKNGRPVFSTAQVKALIGKGVPRDAVQLALKKPDMANLISLWTEQNFQLDASDRADLRNAGIEPKLIAKADKDRRYAFRLFVWLAQQQNPKADLSG